MQPCGKYYPRAKRQGTKKEVCFIHKIMDFQKKIELLFLQLVPHDVIFGMSAWILH
jgi:hypothetical protein